MERDDLGGQSYRLVVGDERASTVDFHEARVGECIAQPAGEIELEESIRGAHLGADMPAKRPYVFGGVPTETIVRAAGVTRGALYHQFADKVGLSAAVYEAIEQEKVMALDASAWLSACGEREVQQVVLLDGPAVLGWQRWREIGMRYGLGLVEGLLTHAIDVGRIPQQPVPALAHVLVGALDEAALYVARADD